VTLSKTLLVIPSERKAKILTVKDLLAFAAETFAFAFLGSVNAQDLFLATDDDFLLPPNAAITDSLEPSQVIKLDCI
jgi:hypothetical protein